MAIALLSDLLWPCVASSGPHTHGTGGSDFRNNRTLVFESGTGHQTSRLSQRSTEPGQPVSRKMPTVIDRGLGNWSRSDLQDHKSTILLGGLSCPHEMNRQSLIARPLGIVEHL